MSETTYSSHYSDQDTNVLGSFAFDTVSGKDYAASKLVFGAIGSATYVSSSNPLPVTVISSALPLDAATATNQALERALLDSLDSKTVVCNTGAVVVSSSVLPTGASTAAKQPAFGVAGSASTDVITVQGIASMTALKVDGSGATQPVSGTIAFSNTTIAVTNAGTFAVQATQSGTWSVRNQDGSGNALTSAVRGSERALSVQIVDASGNQITSFGGGGGGGGGTSSNYTSAFPSVGTAVGFSDGTNMQGARVFDADTGAGSEYVQGVVLRKSASGGSVEAGTSTDPLRVDPTGTTTQPVSGTVAATQSGTWTVLPGNTANTTAWLVTGTGGTFPATQSGTWNIGTLTTVTTVATVTNLAQLGGVAVAMGTGVRTSGTQRVTIATDDIVPASQSGTWTVGISAAQTLATVTTVSTVTNLSQMGGAAIAMGTGVRTSGTQRVTIATDDVVPVSQSGTWTVGISAAQTLATVTTVSTVTNLSQMGGTAIAMGTGVRSAGTQRVTIATDDVVPASQSGTWTVQPGNTANTTAWLTSDRPATSGGLTMSKTISAASTNATSVKGSAGQLYEYEAYNLNASPRYLKFYNKASSPTVGTDTPVRTVLIPGNTAGGGVVRFIPTGLEFTTGIAFAVTGAIGDTDTTAISANEVIVNLGYK